MPAPGVDCDFALSHPSVDSGAPRGFYLKQDKAGQRMVLVARQRQSSVAYTSFGLLAYTDCGPGPRQWTLTAICRSSIVQPRGAMEARSSAQIRAGLLDYYALVGETITFADPAGESYGVKFLSLAERMLDGPELEWEIDCAFLEVPI